MGWAPKSHPTFRFFQGSIFTNGSDCAFKSQGISRDTLMYRGVIGCGVYLPMIMLYTLVVQGIARESTLYKRHLKGSEPRF